MRSFASEELPNELEQRTDGILVLNWNANRCLIRLLVVDDKAIHKRVRSLRRFERFHKIGNERNTLLNQSPSIRPRSSTRIRFFLPNI